MPAVANPCCCTCPPLFADNFNRADETIPSGTLDSTGKWDCLGTSAPITAWQILSDVLAINVPAGLPFNSFARPWARTEVDSYYRQLRASVLLNGPTRTANMLLKLTLHGSNTEAISLYGFVAFSDATHCGSLQIRGEDGSGNPTVILASSPIPHSAMDAGEWHRLTMCVDLDTLLASTHVVTSGGQTFATHYKIPTATVGWSPGPVCLAYLMLNQHVPGLYQWDDFSLGQTKSHASGYGYGYGADNHCPCCGPGGCEGVSDDFEDGVIDCRWLQETGTWTESGGAIHTADSGARLLWTGGWSGLDDDCLPDETTMLTATFQADDYGAEILLFVDWLDAANNHYAKITLESAMGAGDGTLKLFSSTAGELASTAVPGLTKDTSITAKVCLDGGEIDAAIGSVASIHSAITPFGGLSCGLGCDFGSSVIVKFTDFSVSHNLASDQCPNCFSTCISALCSDGVPAAMKVRFTGTGVTGIDGITFLLGRVICCTSFEVNTTDCSIVCPSASNPFHALQWEASWIDALGNTQRVTLSVLELFDGVAWRYSETAVFTSGSGGTFLASQFSRKLGGVAPYLCSTALDGNVPAYAGPGITPCFDFYNEAAAGPFSPNCEVAVG